MKLSSFLVFLLIFNSSNIFSTNYYFSESLGNDSWSGRFSMPNANNTDGPKKSLTAFNALLNTIAKPGDSIFLKRGDQWSGANGITANAAQGNANMYIFIGAYGQGAKPRINKTGAGEILLCRGSANAASSYLKFQDLALVSNSAIGNRPVGVYINESFYSLKPHHIILDGLYITGCQNGMILYQNNITVENCLLEKNGNDNQGQGIFCSATDVQFKSNVLDSNGCGSVFVHSIYISQSKNILFEGNEIKNADDGLKLRASENLIIRNNRIHNTYIHTMHVGGDQSSGTKNVIIEGNLIYDAPQGLRISSESGTQTLLSENIMVRNNIFPAQVFISDNGPVKDVYFFNNLIHTGANQPYLFLSNAINPINLQIINNIFYKTTVTVVHSLLGFISNTGLNGITLDNNLYYYPVGGRNILNVGNNFYTSLTTFRANHPTHEQNGIQGDPNFVSSTDFHLTSLSILAIDKGKPLNGSLDVDFDGRLRPIDGDADGVATVDIGPYEYCCAVATKLDPNIQNESYVYPNPSSEQISIISAHGVPDKIKLIDLSGNVAIETNTCMQQTNLDVSNLNKAVYIIQLYYKSKPDESIKFIKI